MSCCCFRSRSAEERSASAPPKKKLPRPTAHRAEAPNCTVEEVTAAMDKIATTFDAQTRNPTGVFVTDLPSLVATRHEAWLQNQQPQLKMAPAEAEREIKERYRKWLLTKTNRKTCMKSRRSRRWPDQALEPSQHEPEATGTSIATSSGILRLAASMITTPATLAPPLPQMPVTTQRWLERMDASIAKKPAERSALSLPGLKRNITPPNSRRRRGRTTRRLTKN